ncbi:MAG TPA: hypothetical protein PK760_14265, partial [Flavobacteriales bacterium]|nr:hypothetical protein [Flavobacteriales bacterium]
MLRKALALSILLLPAWAVARTCEVKSGSLTIKQALASTADCDTVLVHAGTYIEGTITIERSVVL